jgi:4-alpha-glucanotransferase
MRVRFNLRFKTKYGQRLWVTGNTAVLGNNKLEEAVPMSYLSDEFWQAEIKFKKSEDENDLHYHYFLKTENGEIIQEWEKDRLLSADKKDLQDIETIDSWNHAGEYENAFYTIAFTKLLKAAKAAKYKAAHDKQYTHIFKVKAPLLGEDEVVCIAGSGERLGHWNEEEPVLLEKNGSWWEAKLQLTNENNTIAYKYGIYNIKLNKFSRYENGDNRLLHVTKEDKKKTVLLHDGFIHLPNNTWKGSGVAIPVFSLRSHNSMGVGEFTDIKLLADWANETGLKLIQLLPINDTIASFTWQDSYPYSAVSAYALHPLYINISSVAGEKHTTLLEELYEKQKELNELEAVDYEAVMKAKIAALNTLYKLEGEACLSSKGFKQYHKENKHWLDAYAVFCYYRDKYQSSDFEKWETNSLFDKSEVKKTCSRKSAIFHEIGFYFFVQYHLHLQLKEAVDYTHSKGIIIKGDIPIGISKNSCDAWMAPDLYNMDWQAGAPPDDFTEAGQNWGFPTYNWKAMHADGFAWWKQRFQHMTNYFDAFRIDHILGFFRIWSIPASEVQGIMGRFVPCIPVHINEFGENGIWFDYDRFCKPFITEEILTEVFAEQAEKVKAEFVTANDKGGYDLKEELATQKQIEKHFSNTPLAAETHLREGLYTLAANVLLFEQEGSYAQEFHFRISMEKTSSYKHLIPHVQEKLKGLYINYFYKRQDDFWYKEAMHKLPMLKAATNMLVCGEDLGMVPHCVPDVMKQLGILSLEIQRMPKNPDTTFFIPDEAPYMSVITPSTHDMSTVRSWWEEDSYRTQSFYNKVLGQLGAAPMYCEAWISRAIILQHFYSPAMWSIFQLQDLLGMSDGLRCSNPAAERINNPANPKHYWQYRMHIPLEQLIKEGGFNDELKGYVVNSGR